MRVVFVIPYFHPAWQYGGSPRAAFEYAKALVKRGHSVTVLTTDSMGTFRRPASSENAAELVDGIQVFYYRNISNRLAFRQRLFWPRRLFRELPLRLKVADVLHIHELRSPLTVAAYSAARKLGVPYVVSPHGGLRHLGKAFAKTIYDAIWGSRILAAASAVVVLSDSEAKDAHDLQVPSNHVIRLPNAVSTDLVVTAVPGSFRKKWRIGERQIVAFLGRLHRVKGADILLQAFARLISKNGDVHLVIAGPDDGEAVALRRIASTPGENKVTFCGYLDAQAKAELFADADLLVIPSRSEAFPVTVLEALTSGLPVLLSDSCDLSKSLHPDFGVDSFRSEDVEDLHQKMELILRLDTLRQGVALGRLHVEQKYSGESVGIALEQLYSSIGNGKRHG